MDASTRAKVHQVAAAQYGHLTRQQLVSLGMEPRTIRRWALSDRLVQLSPATFRMPSTPPTDPGWAMAACLETGGVASHRTATSLRELMPHPSVTEVSVRRVGKRKSTLDLGGRIVVVHSTTNLPAEDVLEVRGIPCASVARTMLGLAALVPHEMADRQLFDIVALSVDRELATLPWLWWMLERRRCRGRTGVAALAAVLEELSKLGPTESWLEREFLRLMHEAGIPLPRTQRVVRRTRRFVGRVDFCFEGERIVIEVLGHAFHRTRDQMAADARRANELQLKGFRVLQFTYDDIVAHPERVLATVRAALASS